MKPGEVIQYGFKRISSANLLEHDIHLSYPSRLRGEKWVQACLKPQLEPCVPEEIAFLFEVARGSLVCGMFFLPLASLASEQCYRVLETGARKRCVQLGLLEKRRGKDEKLQDVASVRVARHHVLGQRQQVAIALARAHAASFTIKRPTSSRRGSRA